MKFYIRLFSFVILLSIMSCQTRVMDQQKPLQNNSFELYQKYSIQTNDAKTTKVQVLKVDDENVYGKTNNGEDIVIKKEEIHQVKKFNLLNSILIGVGAVAALIFIPI